MYVNFNRKPIKGNALKLGGKSKDVDSFVDQLKSEGENVTNLAPSAVSQAAPIARAKTSVPTERFISTICIIKIRF